jgi:hypothetical protein
VSPSIVVLLQMLQIVVPLRAVLVLVLVLVVAVLFLP